ncbi:hypothetical protein [Streptosporangium longisporum]|uniref:Uncharacterized protein n=1 Tax=Streptosporangium longisporum TaxID=46187 RepID=A0ABN3XQK7_9ACTN
MSVIVVVLTAPLEAGPPGFFVRVLQVPTPSERSSVIGIFSAMTALPISVAALRLRQEHARAQHVAGQGA